MHYIYIYLYNQIWIYMATYMDMLNIIMLLQTESLMAFQRIYIYYKIKFSVDKSINGKLYQKGRKKSNYRSKYIYVCICTRDRAILGISKYTQIRKKQNTTNE